MHYYEDLSQTMKGYIHILGIFLLVGFVLSTFAFAFSYGISAWHEYQSGSEARQISISGEGKVSVRPDIATFTVSVVTRAKKIGDAQRQNTERSNAVFAYLKGQGVQEKDLTSAGYSIYPQYVYTRELILCEANMPCPPQRPPQIASYEVRHTIEVKIHDLNKVDDLLEGVVASGANEVGSVSFSVDRPEQAQAEARKQAIDSAKEKAKVLARDLGVRLGKIVSFSEFGGQPPIYMRSALKEGMGGDAATSATPEVQPGEQEIRSNVTIVFQLR